MRTFRLSFVVVFSAIFFTVNAADMPRPEYPRPQFERSEWTNLNGTWTYIFDFGNSGAEQGKLSFLSVPRVPYRASDTRILSMPCGTNAHYTFPKVGQANT